MHIFARSLVVFIIALIFRGVKSDEADEGDDFICGDINVDLNYIDCYKEEGTDLPLADHFPENSIFFIQTACKHGLDFREACAVESAAKAHPKRPVNILFAGAVGEKCLNQEPFISLAKYKNVNSFRIYSNRYSKKTPLRDFMNDATFKISPNRVIHTANILRLVTLYKFGGIYLDLDVIITKSLDLLPRVKNWIGKISNDSLGTGLIAISKYGVGKKVSQTATSIFKEDFEPYAWTARDMSDLFKVAIENVCSTSELNKMTASTCSGFAIYPPRFFYALPSNSWKKLFSTFTMKMDDVYAIHTWNQDSHQQRIPNNSFYANIMRKYCPVIYKSYNKPKVILKTKQNISRRNIKKLKVITKKPHHSNETNQIKSQIFTEGPTLSKGVDALKLKLMAVRVSKETNHPNETIQSSNPQSTTTGSILSKGVESLRLKLIDDFLRREKGSSGMEVSHDYWVVDD